MTYLFVLIILLVYLIVLISLLYTSIAFDKLFETSKYLFYKIFLIVSVFFLVSIYSNLHFGLFLIYEPELSFFLPITKIKLAFLIALYAFFGVAQLITLKTLFEECKAKRAFVVLTVSSILITPIVLVVSSYHNYLFLLEILKIFQELFKVLMDKFS